MTEKESNNRWYCVKLSNWKSVFSRVPQELVLGRTLFLIYNYIHVFKVHARMKVTKRVIESIII